MIRGTEFNSTVRVDHLLVMQEPALRIWQGAQHKIPGDTDKCQNEHPEESTKLLEILTKVVVEYMSAQVESGAHMLQIFEAMGMMIDEENFYKFALPCLKEISSELKLRFPDVPLMGFSRGARQV